MKLSIEPSAENRRRCLPAGRTLASQRVAVCRRVACCAAVLLAAVFLTAAPATDGALSTALAAEQTPTKDITFDDVKLDLKAGAPFQRSLLTASVKKLDGAPVRVRGYILPSFQQTGIKQFVLVRDNMQCCFGPGAALHDCILVEMTGSASAEFSVRPVSVSGVFSVREILGPDGTHLAIYHLDGKEVK